MSIENGMVPASTLIRGARAVIPTRNATASVLSHTSRSAGGQQNGYWWLRCASESVRFDATLDEVAQALLPRRAPRAADDASGLLR
jgi:hypothetical protein